MKIIKPNIIRFVLFILIIAIIYILDPIANEYAIQRFSLIPKYFLAFCSILALNCFISYDYIKSWFSEDSLEIDLTNILIAILLFVILMISPFYGLLSSDYTYIVLFMICNSLIRSFKKVH